MTRPSAPIKVTAFGVKPIARAPRAIGLIARVTAGFKEALNIRSIVGSPADFHLF